MYFAHALNVDGPLNAHPDISYQTPKSNNHASYPFVHALTIHEFCSVEQILAPCHQRTRSQIYPAHLRAATAPGRHPCKVSHGSGKQEPGGIYVRAAPKM